MKLFKTFLAVCLTVFLSVPVSAQQTNGQFNLSNFLLEVQKGNVLKHSVMSGMGEFESGNVNVNGEDVARTEDVGGPARLPTPDSAGEQFTIVSDAAADNASGSGVRTVRLYIIRASDGAEHTEDITMNGTTGVDTVITDGMFINDMHGLTVGANGVAQGNITAVKKGGTVADDLYQFIAEGGNKSLVPHRMVPAGHELYLVSWHCTQSQAGKRAAYKIRSTDMYGVLTEGVFNFKDPLYLGGPDSSGEISLFYTPTPEYSIVKVSHWSDNAGTEGSCGWYGVLVED